VKATLVKKIVVEERENETVSVIEDVAETDSIEPADATTGIEIMGRFKNWPLYIT
jgi:hypothetical protein